MLRNNRKSEWYEKGYIDSWAQEVATLNEWLTEFSQKLWEFIQDEWENLENRRRKAQKEQFDRTHSKEWKERWERQNFGKTTDYLLKIPTEHCFIYVFLYFCDTEKIQKTNAGLDEKF